MSEEPKPKKKPSTTIHIINLVSGILGGIACFGFVLIAHRLGVPLEGRLPGVDLSVQDALLVGGALSLGVSIYGAKKLPGAEQ